MPAFVEADFALLVVRVLQPIGMAVACYALWIIHRAQRASRCTDDEVVPPVLHHAAMAGALLGLTISVGILFGMFSGTGVLVRTLYGLGIFGVAAGMSGIVIIGAVYVVRLRARAKANAERVGRQVEALNEQIQQLSAGGTDGRRLD